MPSTFQWLVASRYLRMEKARSLRLHILSAFIVVVCLLTAAASWTLDHSQIDWIRNARLDYAATIRIAKLGVIVGAVLVESFILLVRRLTIFTTISTYGLFLGSGALVIVLSVMSGFESDLRHKILGANAHIVVQTPDRAFTEFADVKAKVEKLPGVVGVTPFLTNEVMISSSSNLSGVVMKGIDTQTVGKVTELARQIDVGGFEYLDDPGKLADVDPDLSLDEEIEKKKNESKLKEKGAPKDDDAEPVKLPRIKRKTLPGVIIGRELAKNLKLFLGDDVSLVSPLGGVGPTGPIPKSKPFRVAGIFFSGFFEYDSKYIYTSLPAAQRFLGSEDEVTGLELKVKDPDQTEPVLAEIDRVLGKGYDVQDWKQMNRNLFSALKLEKIAMFIVLCFIILVAAFSIIANGIMLVMEKGREIAILKSMGASDRAILVVFVILGLYMGLLGTAAGIATGILACLGLAKYGLALDPDVYYITQLPVRMNPWEIAAVFAAAIGIAVTATLYPAWLAARLKPVEGLREGHR
jgi:lipoprotein-releasing system permease protein